MDDEVRLLREAGHEVNEWSPSVESFGEPSSIRMGLGVLWSRRSASHVAELIRAHRPEVVHCHNLFPVLSPAVLRAAGTAPALVMTLHNYRLLCLPATFVRQGRICEACLGRVPWRGVVYRCYRNSAAASAAVASSLLLHRAVGTFDRVSLYLAVSEFVRRKYVEAGVPAQRIHVKPNFVWEAHRRRGPGEYYLFLGRLSSEKGIDTLLDSWRARKPRARLLVVGDGPEAARLRRDAPSGVEFRGAVTADRVPEILARALALVLPSISYEGAPRSVLEAYAAGVPVIASAKGALRELVADGISGFLVESARADVWGAALEKVCSDDVSQQLGEGAWKAWRERHSPRQGLEDLESAYARALGTT